MVKQMSAFAMPRGAKEATETDAGDPDTEAGMPDMDDPRVMRAMSDLERDMEHLDENNPKHMAHMMRKMKELMPSGALPKHFDLPINPLHPPQHPQTLEK